MVRAGASPTSRMRPMSGFVVKCEFCPTLFFTSETSKFETARDLAIGDGWTMSPELIWTCPEHSPGSKRVVLFASIRPEQHKALRLIAFEEKRSIADITREVIDGYIKKKARG